MMHMAYVGNVYQLGSALQKQPRMSDTRDAKECPIKPAGHSLGSH